MNENRLIIETVGSISKKEDLVFFDNPQNLLVFETAHAFPGYNGVVPHDYDPNSLFLITKEKYSAETIFRQSDAIKEKIDIQFNAAYAVVNYKNKEYPAIRLKGLENYSFIPELLNQYIKHGVSFEKSKSGDALNTLIKVTKEYNLEPYDDNCYKDLSDDQMFYFEIPEYINWDRFEKIITDLKYNIGDKNFDAALVFFYRSQRIVDAVRIYKKGMTIDELNVIKDKFLKLL